MDKERKFLFDRNIFDAPPPEEPVEDLPPPPPTFSEEELAIAKDIAFEQGRQQGQREQKESREQYIAQSLEKIAAHFSKLFAAEMLRENTFEKESLRLGILILDQLFPLLTQKFGAEEVQACIEKTLSTHRKTKEITIMVPAGQKSEIESLIYRLREGEQDAVLWRVTEDPSLTDGNFDMEWSDGGAVRDSYRAAQTIRKHLEELLEEKLPPFSTIEHSEDAKTDVSLKEPDESNADIHAAPDPLQSGDKI